MTCLQKVSFTSPLSRFKDDMVRRVVVPTTYVSTLPSITFRLRVTRRPKNKQTSKQTKTEFTVNVRNREAHKKLILIFFKKERIDYYAIFRLILLLPSNAETKLIKTNTLQKKGGWVVWVGATLVRVLGRST